MAVNVEIPTFTVVAIIVESARNKSDQPRESRMRNGHGMFSEVLASRRHHLMQEEKKGDYANDCLS